MKFFLIIILIVGAAYPQPINVHNKFMLAQSYEQAGDFNRALALYEEVYNLQPDNYQYFVSLNSIYIRTKEYDKSVHQIEQRLRQQPNDYSLIGLLGISLYLKGEESKAFALWDAALEKPDAAQNVFRILANSAIELRAFDKAIDILQKGKRIANPKTIYSYELAYLYSIRMQYSKAIDEYCLLIDSDPNQLKQVESRLLSLMARPESVPEIISALEKREPSKNISYSPLLISAYLEYKSFDKALRLSIELDKKHYKNGIDILTLAQRLYASKQYSTASLAFEYLLNTHPNAAFVSHIKLGYAKTFEASLEEEIQRESPLWKPIIINRVTKQKEFEKSIDAYLKIVDAYPNSESAAESHYRIGVIYYERLLQMEKAKESFSNITKHFLMSAFYSQTLDALARIAIYENDLAKAKKYYDQMLAFPRNSQEIKNIAKFRKAELHFYSGEFSEAQNLLLEVADKFKDNTANDAIELSMLLNTKMNDSLLLSEFAKAELFIIRQKPESAVKILLNIEQNQQAVLLKNYAAMRRMESEIALDNYTEALKIAEMLISQESLNLFGDKAVFLQGQIYQFGLNRLDKAKASYEQLLINFPNSLYIDKAREEINILRNKTS